MTVTATAEGTRIVKREEDVAHPPFQPTLPRVNLLPASVAEAFTLRRIRRMIVGVALLIAIGMGAVWYLQGNQIEGAQARFALAQADNATVAARVEALAPVKQMYEQITAEQALVATTLASEPQASLVISRLTDAGRSASAGGPPVAFTSIAITYRAVPEPGDELNPCPNPDPFSSDITIGCVTFSGTASTRDEVSAMLTNVAADPLFVGPYVNSSTVTEATTDGPGGVMFTGSAGVSVAALITPLTPEQIDAIAHPPVVETTDAAAATAGSGQQP